MIVELQNASTELNIPTLQQFQTWLNAALVDRSSATEITVRIVDEAESAKLNETFRHKNGPTNILSFPAELPTEIDHTALGDLVICAPIVNQEAQQQGKTVNAHWAHITIHGALHLCGYDHQTEPEAQTMEQLEIKLLNQLGFTNPYILASVNYHE